MEQLGTILKTLVIALLLNSAVLLWSSSDLHLTQHDVLETRGLSVLLYHNAYHRVFGDQKMNGMEIILHDQRIATSGDVRLSATPEQWDPIPDFQERKRGAAADEVTAFCTYPDLGLSYRIDVRPEAGGFRVAVQLDRPVPAALAEKAGDSGSRDSVPGSGIQGGSRICAGGLQAEDAGDALAESLWRADLDWDVGRIGRGDAICHRDVLAA